MLFTLLKIMISKSRLLSLIFVCIFILECSIPAFALRPVSLKQSAAGIKFVKMEDGYPPQYLTPKLNRTKMRSILTQVGGDIVYTSMEITIPELGQDAFEGARGGLGFLGGDTAAGFADEILGAEVEGVKVVMFRPMYENRVIPETVIDENRGIMRQVLVPVPVDWKNLIDNDNPVNFKILTKPNRFYYSQLRKNMTKPVKILADENGRQIKVSLPIYDHERNEYRNFDVAAFVISRGGTPVILLACQETFDWLYPLNIDKRLQQQVLIGHAVPAIMKRLGIKPKIFHMNEAHTVISAAVMLQDPYFEDTSFVFTNHTPLRAGLQIWHNMADRFNRLSLPERYDDDKRNIHINFRDIFIRTDTAERENLDFSNAAMVLAHIVTSVSAEHADTLEHMYPWCRQKIVGILNGISDFWKSEALVKKERRGEVLTPEKLWEIHRLDKESLLDLVEKRTGVRLKMDEPVLGSVRRIDFYKQQYPMLKDIVRALCQDRGVETEIIIDGRHERVKGLGMQLIVGGIIVDELNETLQGWIREFISWMKDPEFKGRFVFVSGNDIEIMHALATGCDCWVEMPARSDEPPYNSLEACGTSGGRAAVNGNIAITTGGWGNEVIQQYDAQADTGDGFFLDEVTPLALYKATATISELYYAWMIKGDKRWLRFKKRRYESAKSLNIRNMVRRYLLEAYLPAIKRHNIISSVRWIGNLKPDVSKNIHIALGQKVEISAEIILKDQKFLNWIKPEIWTDMGGKWHAVEMPEIVQINDNTFRFTGSLRPENNRYFSYKVRFKLGNNFYVYLPKEPGNNGHIIAIEPEDIDSIVLRLRSKGVDSKFVNGVISDHSFAWKWRPGGESGEEHLLFDKGERDLLTFLDVAEKVGLEENGFYSLCFHCSREGYKGDVLTHLSRVFLEGKPALSVLKEKVAVYERLIESIPGQNAAAILTRIEITQKAIAFVKNAIRAAIDPSFKPKLRIPESEPLPAVEDKHKRLLYEVDAAA